MFFQLLVRRSVRSLRTAVPLWLKTSLATGYNQWFTDYHHRDTEHTEDSQRTLFFYCPLDAARIPKVRSALYQGEVGTGASSQCNIPAIPLASMSSNYMNVRGSLPLHVIAYSETTSMGIVLAGKARTIASKIAVI